MPSMKLDTPVGAKILFTAAAGRPEEIRYALTQLQPGGIYTVDLVDEGRWASCVRLREFPGQWWNTSLFENM